MTFERPGSFDWIDRPANENEAPLFESRSKGEGDDALVYAIHRQACQCMACHTQKADGIDDVQFAPGAAEGQDTPGNTSTTATLSPGSAVLDEIEQGGDSDWFAIQLTAGETYTFTTFLPPGELADSILTLRGAGGQVLAVNDDASFSAGLLFSEITYTATTSGTFYLDVTGFGGSTGSYYLSSSRPVDDAVAGDDSTTATLTVGDPETAGALEQTGDRDWYAVTLEAGQSYTFFTSATGGGNDVDTTLTLRTSNGEAVAYNDDSNGTYSSIRFTATTSGTFYLDVAGWADSEEGDYQVTAVLGSALPELDNDGIAAQLLYGTNGNENNLRRWNVSAGDTLTVNITTLSDDGQFLARESLQLWSDITGILFEEVTGTAQITFQDTDDGAYAASSLIGGFIDAVTVNVSTEWLASFGTTLDSYSFQTYLHEVGHALGLRHPGPYNGNGTFEQDAVFLNDSWATTLMSYFSQTETPLFNDQGFSRVFTLTPMIGDVTAIRVAYGDYDEVRTGDTVYGVGNNTGRTVYGVGPETTNNAGNLLAFVIVDSGGIDTLDYSSFSADQFINLIPETFSNVGGSIGNMNIARGTVIENAVAGSGDDTLIGNDTVNLLTGGLGNDEIDGGSNVDTAIVSGARGDYGVSQMSTGVFQISGPDGTDILTRIEYLQFDDETIRLLPGTGVSVNFDTADPSVYQSSMNAIRDFDGNALGGDGSWLRIGAVDVNGDGDIDQILVNDAIGRFATVGTAPDGLVYFDDYSWAGETRVAGIYIDPLVESGDVEAGSEFDSQVRFQNDLFIENINRVLGADDYDGDGFQEVYFALTDGTAFLRAIMHADGNIFYANYQSEEQVIDYLTANGYDESTFGDWFDNVDSAEAQASPAFAAAANDAGPVGMDQLALTPFEEPVAEFYG